MIIEVVNYQTEDGKIFLSKREAEEHEKKRNIELKLSTFVDEHMFINISKDMIFEVLLREREELLKILTGE